MLVRFGGSARARVWSVACIVAALTAANSSQASDGKPTKGGSSSSGGSSAPTGAQAEGERPEPSATERSKSGEETEEGDDPVHVGIDLVAGSGKVGVASTAQPTSLEGMPTNTIGTSQVTSESLLVGAGVEFHHFEVGARLPFTFGSINPTGATSRHTTALGNLEIEGAYVHELRHGLALVYALGITPPTAQGQEVPDKASDLTVASQGVLDQNSYDRGALNLAAASSRGWEENALFEVKRFGIIPKVELRFEHHGLKIEPYVKLENLIDTSGKADHSYLAELVIGGRIAYRIGRYFEPGVRVWTNLNGELQGISSSKPVGVVEPELRFPLPHVTALVGGILPFAGPLENPYYFGVRVAAVVHF